MLFPRKPGKGHRRKLFWQKNEKRNIKRGKNMDELQEFIDEQKTKDRY